MVDGLSVLREFVVRVRVFRLFLDAEQRGGGGPIILIGLHAQLVLLALEGVEQGAEVGIGVAHR
ncbi:hypothetical protein D3C72_2251090 [compost metagenome]